MAAPARSIGFEEIVGGISTKEGTWEVRTAGAGPAGKLPLTAEMLLERPSGDIFGLTQNAGMGWDPRELGRPQFLISQHPGRHPRRRRHPDRARLSHRPLGDRPPPPGRGAELKELGAIPFAGFCSDPCDGRTQGTTGMFDSLAYRNDAAIVLRRLTRSLPTRAGVLGVATCDKGLPAMMMALAALRDLPCVLVPGGVTLPPEHGEDAGTVQTIGARFAHGEISLEEAAGPRLPRLRLAGRRLPVPRHRGHVPGGGRGAGPLAAAFRAGALGPAALARHGAALGARAGGAGGPRHPRPRHPHRRRHPQRHGGARGLGRLDEPAPAPPRDRARRGPVAAPRWRTGSDVNRRVPRLVDVLPNGPRNHPTVRVFLAGGVPEVMLHLRRAGLLDERCLTVSGEPLGKSLDWWEGVRAPHRASRAAPRAPTASTRTT